MITHDLIPTDDSYQADELRQAIKAAQKELLAAEAELAEEQAAVNAFRMHCRLKLDRWIDRLMELQAERQSLRTRVELQRQAGGMSGSFDRDDPFWKEEVFTGGGPSAGEEELLLPTDVPRDKAAEKRLYRELARRFHPDLGQTALEIAYRTEMMTAVNKAYAAGDNQALYDLAGELDPEAVAAVEAISSAEIRRLKRQLVRLQQRRRRVKQRLVVSREENTARLWRKAQRLETDDTHWWEVVRREIERAIERLEKEVARLSEMIEPPQEGEQAQVGT
ncbi:MAG: J domain-containing protein [Chloroflexota bacterium]|jgi:hypothetical protein